MINYQSRNWVEVHLDRLQGNLKALRAHLPAGCKTMGVVKANAYGHGDGRAAHALVQAGAEWLAVSNVEEALSLRRQGISCPILVLVATPMDSVPDLIAENLTQTVFSAEYGRILAREAAKAGAVLPVHIKIDTGMTRMGFSVHQAEEIAQLCRHPHLNAQGVYTHFACADEGGEGARAYTREQYAKFTGLLKELEAKGVTFALRHCCNSAGAMQYPEMCLDMVRPGIMLYGQLPGEGCRDILPLLPVMEWYAKIALVKTVKAGIPISYGRTYTAAADMLVATVPLGYADGYGREQGGVGGWALVRGKRAPVVGRVCMDQLMLDVSGIPDVQAGDTACFAGAPGAPGFEEMAGRAGTISYEKLCAVGRRVPRIYKDRGETVGTYTDLRP